jgi:hypothetical protein
VPETFLGVDGCGAGGDRDAELVHEDLPAPLNKSSKMK